MKETNVGEWAQKRRGIALSMVAALVVAAASVLIRQRHTPDLLITSDEGWQPSVRVAIAGEVVGPGTYTLGGDARLSDLVTAAGGYTERAQRDALNPAARLGDGREYTIPTQSARVSTATTRAGVTPPLTTATVNAGATAPTRATTQATDATSVANGKTNINTASKEEMETLPAIGPTLAQRIVDDRTVNGPYAQIEDLARVRGISAHTVDQLRDRITVGP